jgi:hypothetical protein
MKRAKVKSGGPLAADQLYLPFGKFHWNQGFSDSTTIICEANVLKRMRGAVYYIGRNQGC